MKKTIVLLLALPMFLMAKESSQEGLLGAYDFDFVAPIVSGDSDVPAHAGLIYYDIGVGLKVINPSGTAEIISAGSSGSPVVSPSSSVIKIMSAHVTGGNPTPTINRQDGSWLTFSTRAGAGEYVWTISGCNTTPNCATSCTPANSNELCSTILDKGSTGSTTRSATTIRTQSTTGNGSTTDAGQFDLVCSCEPS